MPRNPRGAWAWGLFDLGNTMFAIVVVSLVMAQWVTVDRGAQDLWFSATYGLSMLAVALTAPYLGVWSDRIGRRIPFLAALTVLCVLGTAALGALTPLPGRAAFLVALAVFAVANYGFQTGLVFYNALLPEVSTPRDRGRVSGLGVGLGYVGSLLGLVLVVPFIEGTVPGLGWELPGVRAGGRTAAFLPTAVLFAIFAVPLFLRVQDRSPRTAPRPPLREGWRRLTGLLRDRRHRPGLGWFLLGNFFLLDGIHTAILFMAVFAENVVGLSDAAKAVLFMLATVPAVGGAFAAGWLSDRIGPRPVLLVTAWLWMLVPLVIAAVPTRPVVYTMGAVSGILLGALWTSTRPFLLRLVPGGEEGSVFGLYALCNRAAAILGPQIWGLIVLWGAPLGPDRYRLAVGALAVLAGVGALLLHRVPSPGPSVSRTGSPASA